MPTLDSLALSDPRRLAIALRGAPGTLSPDRGQGPSTPTSPLLPRALAAWERERPAREAEALRIATTPRAHIGGEEVERVISNIPTVEHRISKLITELTPPTEPTPDNGG